MTQTDSNADTNDNEPQEKAYSSIYPKPIQTEQTSTPSPKTEISTNLEYKNDSDKKPAFKLFALIMGIISVPIALGLLFVSGLLLADTGFFGAKQEPWGPAYVFLIGIPVLMLAVIRMWKGQAWNSLMLFGSVPPMYMVIVAQKNYVEISGGDTFLAYLIGVAFLSIWIMLLLKRTKLAFLLVWPLIATGLALQVLEVLNYHQVDLSYEPFLVAVLSAAAWVVVLLDSKIPKAAWVSAGLVVLVTIVLPRYVLDPQRYASSVPNSISSEVESVPIKQSLLRSETIGNIEVDLIEHGHYFSGFPPPPQIMNNAVLVPYVQPGSSCDDWVALDTTNLTFSYNLKGGADYCTPPQFVRVYEDEDLVIHATSRELTIQKLSSGAILLKEDAVVGMYPQVIDNVLYIVSSPSTSTGADVFIKAFDLQTSQQKWESTINGVHHPRLPTGQRLYTREFFAASETHLIIQFEEVYGTDVRQIAVNRDTGLVEVVEPAQSYQLGLSEGFNYYFTEEDINRNIKLKPNLGLAEPIRKLTIKQDEVTLVEPCTSFPVLSGRDIVCISEKYIQVIHANLLESDLPPKQITVTVGGN